MKQKQTEREKWLYLAKCWDEAKECRRCSPRCRMWFAKVNGVDCAGICFCLDILDDAKMRKRFSANRKPILRSSFDWPNTAAGAKKRAQFCRRMAELCKGKRVTP